jgi:diguanylate cyclase (GGDEF)-like protein/PAS domain S-box-containing protein
MTEPHPSLGQSPNMSLTTALQFPVVQDAAEDVTFLPSQEPKSGNPNQDKTPTVNAYKALFDVAFEGLVIHSDLIALEVNTAICQIYGYDRSELIGRSILDFILPAYHDLIKANIGKNYSPPYAVGAIKRDGTQFIAEIQAKTVILGDHYLRVAAVRDISDRQLIEKELITIKNRYQALFNHKSDAVFIHGFTESGKPTNFIEVNDAACKSLGYSRQELLGMSPKDIVPKDFVCDRSVMETLSSQNYATNEVLHQAKNGTIFPVELSLVKLEDQGQPLVIGFARDISDRKAIETKLERIAALDYLTQIANRRQFDQYLEAMWEKSWRDQSPISLIMGDIDCFKLYNDRYGHQVGDKCLKAVAAAIAHSVKRPTDLVARYGGEEFGIILPHTKLIGAVMVAQNILKTIKDLNIPHDKSLVNPYITMSLGVATLVPTSSDCSILVKAADCALYNAKRSGKDRFYAVDTVF